MRFLFLALAFIFHSECLAQSTTSVGDSFSGSLPTMTPTPLPTVVATPVPPPAVPEHPSPLPLPEPPLPPPPPEDKSRCGERPLPKGMTFASQVKRFGLAQGPEPFLQPAQEWIKNDSGGQWVHSISHSRSTPAPQGGGAIAPLPPGPCDSCTIPNPAPEDDSDPTSESYLFSLVETWKCQNDNTWFLEQVQWVGQSNLQSPTEFGGVQFSGLLTFQAGVPCPQVSASGSGMFQKSWEVGGEKREESYFLSSTLRSETSGRKSFLSGANNFVSDSAQGENFVEVGECFFGPNEAIFDDFMERFQYTEKQKQGNTVYLLLDNENRSNQYNVAGFAVAGGTVRGKQESSWDEQGNAVKSYFEGDREAVVGPNQFANVANVELTKQFHPLINKLKSLDFRSQGNFGTFNWDLNGALQSPSDLQGLAAFEQKKLEYLQAKDDAQNASLPNAISWPSAIADQ